MAKLWFLTTIYYKSKLDLMCDLSTMIGAYLCVTAFMNELSVLLDLRRTCNNYAFILFYLFFVILHCQFSFVVI